VNDDFLTKEERATRNEYDASVNRCRDLHMRLRTMCLALGADPVAEEVDRFDNALRRAMANYATALNAACDQVEAMLMHRKRHGRRGTEGQGQMRSPTNDPNSTSYIDREWARERYETHPNIANLRLARAAGVAEGGVVADIGYMRRKAIEIKLADIFNNRWFDITMLEPLCNAMNVPIPQDTKEVLKALHCVNWDSMGEEYGQQVRSMIRDLFSFKDMTTKGADQ
jgi:hypothetical protein